jgi:uncharacterized protein YjbI with pentapeptide repeats
MEDLSRQKIFSRDFSGQKLSHAKMRSSLFHRCNFDRADMTEADCEGSEFLGSTFRETICYRTNFKDAKLAGTVFEPKDCFGMTVTLQCKTFDGVKVSPLWWMMWAMFLTIMKPEKLNGEDLIDRAILMIGPDRYLKLKTLLQKREL